MNGYFFACIDFDKEQQAHPGVIKKINQQLDVFRSNFDDVEIISKNYKTNFLKKLLSRLPGTPNYFNIKNPEQYCKRDFIYFRCQSLDTHIRKFFTKIKTYNPNCKILVEFPDFPYYQGEIKWYAWPIIWKDKRERKYFQNYVDRAVVFAKDKHIFGVPAINTINGISVSEISPRESRASNHIIHMIAVSTMYKHHGYDRVLRGLGEYYKSGGSRNIIFHLVGTGEAMKDYVRIIHKYNIESHVLMHGFKSGKELDEIYNTCELAFSGLGTFRKNYDRLSSLKVREYLAKGVPVIYSGNEDLFENVEFPYQLKISDDKKPIDMNLILNFYDKIYLKGTEDKQTIIKNIRKFALEKCDMSVTMKPIIDYIKSFAKEQGVAE